MSVNWTIPLCSCGILLGNEGVILWDTFFLMKGLRLAGSLPHILDASYDAKSLLDDTQWDLRLLRGISLSDSIWLEYSSNFDLSCFFPVKN